MEDKDQSKQIEKKELRGKSPFRKKKNNYINILREMRRVCTLNAMKKIQRTKIELLEIESTITVIKKKTTQKNSVEILEDKVGKMSQKIEQKDQKKENQREMIKKWNPVRISNI